MAARVLDNDAEAQEQAVFEKGYSIGLDARGRGETSAGACRRACPCPNDAQMRRAFIRGWKAGTGRTSSTTA